MGNDCFRAMIAIVDDEPPNRMLLRALLEPEGYGFVEASNGYEMIDLLANREPIDLVLLDVMMPGIDGIEVCRRIRQEHGNLTLPIIFVTALSDRDSRIRGKAAGGDEFLSKPIESIELLVRVDNLLKVKKYHEIQAERQTWLEQELDRVQGQLLDTQRMALLGQIAGSVGHELANITGVLNGAVDFVATSAAEGQPPAAEDIELLRRVMTHLASHARNLLRIGRPGSQYEQITDLRDIVNGALDMLGVAGRTKRVSIDTSFPDRALPIACNRARIEQVLLNLLFNAIDATMGLTDRKPAITVTLELAQDNLVRCSIMDNGWGIPVQQREQIFSPYFTTKPADKGTGLGLAVVRQVVAEYNGQILLESQVGTGTTFTVVLPLDQGAGAV